MVRVSAEKKSALDKNKCEAKEREEKGGRGAEPMAWGRKEIDRRTTRNLHSWG